MLTITKLCALGLRIWIIQLFLVQNVYSVSDSGGYCLAEAQYRCFGLSTKLVIAERRDTSSVCRCYKEYNMCIKSKVTEIGCTFTQEEATLYNKDVIIWYQKSPYSCPAAPSDLKYTGPRSSNTANPVNVAKILIILPAVVIILLSGVLPL